jgi:hypothetical protein
MPRAAVLPILLLVAAGVLDAADADPAPAPAAAASDDWYCIGHDAAHTYTSGDALAPPLKLRWAWQAPVGGLLHAVSSGGKVIAHARHVNDTPVGQRNGAHNYYLDLATGMLEKEDPSGTTPNDHVLGYGVGTCSGDVYQCDDGGPPVGGGDVWGTPQLSLATGWWAVVQHSKIDGPDPGIYCMKIGAGIGSGWSATNPIGRDLSMLCDGDVAIGPKELYAAMTWKMKGPEAVDGLCCHELETGKRRWNVPGQFIAVSAGADFCVAVDQRKAMVVLAAADGAVLASTGIAALPDCPPMVVGASIRLADEGGGLTEWQLVEKNGKRSLKQVGQVAIGKFTGPKLKDRYDAGFCFAADGSLYTANGATVSGAPGTKDGKRWSWTVPGPLAKTIGPLGHPVIARGKLIVTGAGGVLCFDREGAPK